MGAHLPNDYYFWIPTFTLDGSTKTFQSVFMGKANGELTASAIDGNMRTYFCSAGRPFFATAMFVGFTLASSECYLMQAGVQTYFLNESPIIGTLAGSLGTPINTSILIKKNTFVVGRRYRGRFMFPNMWIAEANISQAGIISGGSITSLQGLWDPALAAWHGGPYDAVLGHTSSEVLPTIYSSVTIQPKIGTMRRRIRGF